MNDQNANCNEAPKLKSKSLPEEIREVLYTKAIKAAQSLKPVGLPESSVEKAAQSIAKRDAEKHLVSAMKYVRKCASTVKYNATDLMNEILSQHGVAITKKHRAPKEKESPNTKSKGGPHGTKS